MTQQQAMQIIGPHLTEGMTDYHGYNFEEAAINMIDKLASVSAKYKDVDHIADAMKKLGTHLGEVLKDKALHDTRLTDLVIQKPKN